MDGTQVLPGGAKVLISGVSGDRMGDIALSSSGK